MVELYFASRADFDAAMVSDLGRQLLAEMEDDETGGPTMFLAEVA